MVLMTMRDNYSAQLICMLKHIGIIRQNQVNTRMVVVRKHEACVIKHHIVTALESGHILTDGIKTTQRDNTKLRLRITLAGMIVLS